MTPAQISSGLVGSHPTIYLGEMLVNFGYLGCAVSSIIIGIFLGSVNRVFSFVVRNTQNTSSFFIALYAILAVNSLEVATGSIFILLSHLFIVSEFLWITLIFLLLSNRVFVPKPI
jgi:hypothetical protein